MPTNSKADYALLPLYREPSPAASSIHPSSPLTYHDHHDPKPPTSGTMFRPHTAARSGPSTNTSDAEQDRVTSSDLAGPVRADTVERHPLTLQALQNDLDDRVMAACVILARAQLEADVLRKADQYAAEGYDHIADSIRRDFYAERDGADTPASDTPAADRLAADGLAADGLAADRLAAAEHHRHEMEMSWLRAQLWFLNVVLPLVAFGCLVVLVLWIFQVWPFGAHRAR